MKRDGLSGAGLGFLACAGLLTGACHRHKEPALVPGQVVRMDSELLDQFHAKIEEYVQLRHAAVDAVPALPPEASAEQIAARQKALTAAIIQFRRQARQGEIFTPEIEAAFRRIFRKAFEGPGGVDLVESLKDGNPSLEGTPRPANPSQDMKTPVKLGVNVVYPDNAPLSSVPSTLLLKIPALPDEVRYRFVGRALIARDTEANVILDFIRDIVPDASIPR